MHAFHSSKNISIPVIFDNIFSCEEAALEGQKEVCVSVRPCVPKTEFHLSSFNSQVSARLVNVQVYTKALNIPYPC